MSERVQKTKSSAVREDVAVEELPAEADKGIVDLTDEFLDEIDGLLEENASDFVASYKQQGGE